jgi:glycine betaine/proline transport system permease protein
MKNMFSKIPIDRWVEDLVSWLVNHFQGFFDGITSGIGGIVDALNTVLLSVPPLILIILFAAFAWWKNRWTFALFTFVGLFLVDNLELWKQTMETLSLVLTSVIISVIIGIPLGIWSARRASVRTVITPILDFMQTMPAFVYLLPAIFFFGIGMVPGVIASVIFAMPPTIRLTNLGIRQVPADLIEAADAFGSTSSQKLFKVQLPLAMPTIMAGINQSIMLALSMVVIASMVGAPGLGAEVYRAVTQLKIGTGFEGGLAIVILAIVLDRITQNIKKK